MPRGRKGRGGAQPVPAAALNESVPTRGRGRSRGRVRGWGRGRGRGGGRGGHRPTQYETLKRNLKATKKLVNMLPAEQRQEYKARKRAKELERVLLPDAPPLKRKCIKPSPERAPCRLVPGTPEVLPPRKPRPWEIIEREEIIQSEEVIQTEEIIRTEEITQTESQQIQDDTDSWTWQLRVCTRDDASSCGDSADTPTQFDWTTLQLRNENWPKHVVRTATAALVHEQRLDEIEGLTAPETERLTAPETEGLTAPETERLTAPETERLTAPETEGLTAPETEGLTAPETERLTAPETERLTAPETEGLTAPEAEGLTAPETDGLTALETESLTAPETERLTAPETEGLTAPETERLTAPETEGLTAPETEGLTAPETDGLTAPETEGLTAPEAEGLTAPETDGLTALETESLTAPETERLTAPETEGLTAPETERLTAPETEGLTAPETEGLTAPETDGLTAPETESLTAPETEGLTAPETERLTAPETEGLTAPETEGLTAPETERLTAPETEGLTAPETEILTAPAPERTPAIEPVLSSDEIEVLTTPALEVEVDIEDLTVLAPEPTPASVIFSSDEAEDWPSHVMLTTAALVHEQRLDEIDVLSAPKTSVLGTRDDIFFSDLSLESSRAKVSHWLENLGDDASDLEEEDILLAAGEGEFNFTDSAPILTDDNLNAWLAGEDEAADQAIRNLLSEDHLHFEWSSDPNTFLGKPEVFQGQSGPTFPVNEQTKAMDIFLKFFNDEVFDCIVRETNRRILTISRPLKKHSRFTNIEATSKEEMAVFFAMLILQGLCPLAVEQEYFNDNGFLTLTNFKRLMTYNRFLILKRLLHFTDNESSTSNLSVDEQKLRKLGPLLRLLSKNFSELYRPGQQIAIDESLLKWHGRLSFAQKISSKAAKVGVKTYELCESSTGYLWKFFVYTGKGQSREETEGDAEDHGDDEVVKAPTNATAKIVIDLVTPLLNLGHVLTMDNFYNSPLLARYLKSQRTDCMGTLRVNREFVPDSIKEITKRELRHGELVQTYTHDMSILLWKDSNIISMISTFHGGQIGAKEKYGTFRFKPQVVLDYNLAMGGVDKKDQLLSAHPMERSRNLAWYKKVFRRLLNVTILNAFIIFKTKNPKISHRDFRKTLANELIATFHKNTIESMLMPDPEIKVVAVIKGKKDRPILSGNHFVGKGPSRYRTCVWCKKSRTFYICKQCNVSLCLDCFERYHTLQ